MQKNESLFKYLDYQRRYAPTIARMKVNLYRDFEVEGVAQAYYKIKQTTGYCPLECIMVADSYLMTHMGRDSTKLSSQKEKEEFFKTMLGLVRDVRQTTNKAFQTDDRPFILGDMPDGATDSIEVAIKAGVEMMDAGSDAIKVEVSDENGYEIVSALSEIEIPIIAHIGYTPQKVENRSFGNTFDEAKVIIEAARQLKRSGACGLVLERVNEVINQILCLPRIDSLPIYSIFSGRTNFGGQSLNVWDSVIKPDFNSNFFPPTATLTRNNYKELYNVSQISNSMEKLMHLTMAQQYPKSPKRQLFQVDIDHVVSTLDPWIAGSLSNRSEHKILEVA